MPEVGSTLTGVQESCPLLDESWCIAGGERRGTTSGPRSASATRAAARSPLRASATAGIRATTAERALVCDTIGGVGQWHFHDESLEFIGNTDFGMKQWEER